MVSPAEFDAEAALPSVKDLVLRFTTGEAALEQIPRTFPALESLLLTPAARGGFIDLSPLEALPGLRVGVIGGSPITGGEGLVMRT
ncbi:hypothetical protein [Streptomyces atratus]|uniref:hypothetical protein n=1 Tax=Streptomyces atratus TaxID=1893 RepID=UPI00340B083D